jgi:poly[(R)-3-hydroxyalkanoate] polymerase subunit PhaC
VTATEQVQSWAQDAVDAQPVAGSWWPHYSSWLAGRSGGQQKSPGQLGRKGYPVLAAAPGTYVHDH